MLRWFLYIVIVVLIIDHAYTHWGPMIINSVASGILGRPVEIVKEARHKESVIDRGIRTVRESINRILGKEDER